MFTSKLHKICTLFIELTKQYFLLDHILRRIKQYAVVLLRINTLVSKSILISIFFLINYSSFCLEQAMTTTGANSLNSSRVKIPGSSGENHVHSVLRFTSALISR
jgi:hypothetical protein